MDTLLIIVSLSVAFLWAMREIYNERLKTKQIPKLKKAILENEEQSKEVDSKTLDDASAADVVDFLNELHKDD